MRGILLVLRGGPLPPHYVGATKLEKPCSLLKTKVTPKKLGTCNKTKHSQQTSRFVCFTLCFFFFLLHVRNDPHAKGSSPNTEHFHSQTFMASNQALPYHYARATKLE